MQLGCKLIVLHDYGIGRDKSNDFWRLFSAARVPEAGTAGSGTGLLFDPGYGTRGHVFTPYANPCSVGMGRDHRGSGAG